jgi:hypothetical protein
MHDDTEHQARRWNPDLPLLIADAGEAAVRAYREFLDDPKLHPSTRSLYRSKIRRFLRWAEAKEISLAEICAFDLAIYESESSRTLQPTTLRDYRLLLRRFFTHLKQSAVIPENPCDDSAPEGDPSVDTATGWQAAVDAAQFALFSHDLWQFTSGQNGQQANVPLCETVLALGQARSITPLSWLDDAPAPRSDGKTGPTSSTPEAPDAR